MIRLNLTVLIDPQLKEMTESSTELLVFLLSNQEVPGSNLGPETGHPD
jgi:hypothetical protein